LAQDSNEGQPKMTKSIGSIAGIAGQIRRGEVSAQEVAERTWSEIQASSSFGCFLHVPEEDALLAQAAAVDLALSRGEDLGLLAGVPIAVKDNLCTSDMPTTAASRMLEGFRPPYDATVVERLRAAGAILIGKTNLDEFAMGSSNETSYFGTVRNPCDPQRIPGGSSGGSAAAVALDLCCASLGSDTGGSVRQPASHCGVVGLKPTYGRVSRYGLIAFASSLDQVGPITKNVHDASVLLRVIAGHDARDMTSSVEAVPAYGSSLDQGVEGLRIGLPREYFVFEDSDSGIDPEVVSRVSAAVDALREAGATFVELSLPHTQYAVATYYLIATAEASSNLARYDGVRFGHRASEPSSLSDLYSRSRSEGFGAEVKRRILLGTFVLSAGYYDAYYGKAQQVRTLIKRDFDEAFGQVDVILTPTTPSPASLLGEKVDDPLQMYLEDIYTISANLAGIPAMSVPYGRTSGGLPVGVQLLAPHFEEERLFRVGRQCERSLDE
jgi:aspartyl-tRNA(Asn)/glutamyl-tRNA(Gln) amidotransferase subunit A